MEYRTLGQSGIRISAIIMGTWQAGKSMWAGITDRESSAAIQAAFDAGISTFDTASVYGDGHSERIVGAALAGVRERAVIASKVFPGALRQDQVFEACESSLSNLGTDYLDLYQIHWPAGSFGTEAVPIEETMHALLALKEQGKIRAIGVSNFSRTQIEEARRFGPIDSLQPPYSLFWRQIERAELPYCQEHGLAVLAYSALAQGFLTGRFGPGHHFAAGDHRARNKLFRPEHYARVQQALAQLRPIAERHEASLAQLALAWVIAHPGVSAIAGARSAKQATQNAKAVRVRLSTADLAELDRIGQSVATHLGDDPVMWEF